MSEAKAGDIRYYHESGSIFQVEVLDVREKNYGKSRGLEYELKVMEIIEDNGRTPPQKGQVFSVWKNRASEGYAGWSLQ